jgi:hypothetical protein
MLFSEAISLENWRKRGENYEEIQFQLANISLKLFLHFHEKVFRTVITFEKTNWIFY